MIDWLSFNIGYEGPPVGSVMLKRDLRTKEYEQLPPRPAMVEGSYSSKISVQVIGQRMYISGNPVKWLTGQNVCGSNDIHALLVASYEGVCAALDLPDCQRARRDLKSGAARLTRVDCTFSYKVGTDDDVVAWLAAMENACTVRYRGRGHFDSGMCSLMFGLTGVEGGKPKASRRSTFKFYNKAREMMVHRPKCSDELFRKLWNDVLGCVRGEALYRGLELKTLGYDVARKWNKDTAYMLHKRWVNRMEMTEGYKMKSEKEIEMPRQHQAVYHLWRSGVDVRGMVSRTSFYRHRKYLMSQGIDISLPLIVTDDPVQVVPVLRVLEACPVSETEHETLFWDLVKAAA